MKNKSYSVQLTGKDCIALNFSLILARILYTIAGSGSGWGSFDPKVNQIHSSYPNGEALEVDLPCHPRSILHQDYLALGTRGKAREESSEDHLLTNSGERNATDGKDLEQHFSHGEGPVEVEGSRCCPTRQLA